jgi:RNA polymerase sigma factor (sigma-70 family)
MARGLFHSVLHYLRGHASASADDGDGRLVERFAAAGDPDAFAALLHRHAPLVWGVCRRLLGESHDAEDAFQAAFLVLVKNAAAVRKRESVASWLYGVAYRVASRARKARGRRAGGHVEDCAAAGGTEQDVAAREVRAVLDAELQRLPEKYRGPVVLCDLQGQTLEEAARLLGCPRATVATRLARARQRLRDRLVRRGVAPAALAALLAAAPAEAAPTELLTAATRACALQAAGNAAALATQFPRAAALAQGVKPTMPLTLIRLAALAVLTLTLAAAATRFLPDADDVQPAPVPAPAPVAALPQEKPPEQAAAARIVFTAPQGEAYDLFLISADGTGLTALTKSEGAILHLEPAWSPDGTRILFRRGEPGSFDSDIYVMDADGRNLRQLTKGGVNYNPVWSPNGKRILFSTSYPQGTVVRVMDGDGGNLKTLSKRAGEVNPAWSPDGKQIVFSSNAFPQLAVCVVDADGGNFKALTENGGGNDMYPVWSPDGKKIAFCSDRGGAGGGLGLYVMDADGSNVKRLSLAAGEHRAAFPAWSPDSKRLAYSDNGGDKGPVYWELHVVNADGTGHKQLTRLEGNNRYAAWSPDGKELCFRHSVTGKSVPNRSGICVIDADGSNLRELHKAAKDNPDRPMWKPK